MSVTPLRIPDEGLIAVRRQPGVAGAGVQLYLTLLCIHIVHTNYTLYLTLCQVKDLYGKRNSD